MSTCPGWACPPNAGPLDCPSKTCGGQSLYYNTRYAAKNTVGYPNPLNWWLIWKQDSQQNIDDGHGCTSTVDGFQYVNGDQPLPPRAPFNLRWQLLPSDRSTSNQGVVKYGDIVYLQAEFPIGVWYDLTMVGPADWVSQCCGLQFTTNVKSALPLLLYDRYGHATPAPIQQGEAIQFGSTTKQFQVLQLQTYPIDFNPPFDRPIWFFQGEASANLLLSFFNSDSGQVDLVPAVSSCSTDKDCGPGQICQAGACIPDPGTICNPPCSVTQLCVNNQCITPGNNGKSSNIWLFVGVGASILILVLIVFANVMKRLRARVAAPAP